MIVKNNIRIGTISWLSYSYGGGCIKEYYEPETLDELITLSQDFYKKELSFDIIGHTSNILFSLDCVLERVISTRKLTKYEIKNNCIYAECGVHVRNLSKEAVNNGYKGFEGLIDLPGTIASALYGNAGCYGCSVSSLLEKAQILTSDGIIRDVDAEWFDFRTRSSALKCGKKEAIILSVELKKVYESPEVLKEKSALYHQCRMKTQPGPSNSLGSVFSSGGQKTLLGKTVFGCSALYGRILKLCRVPTDDLKKRTMRLELQLLNARELEPYLWTWNWYQWKDEKAHTLFRKYVELHGRLFKNSNLEIEIKK